MEEMEMMDRMDDRGPTEQEIDREQRAERIAETLREAGYGARVWSDPAGLHVRVYVSRDLSRRAQEMGHVEIEADGSINATGMQRAQARVREIARAAMEA